MEAFELLDGNRPKGFSDSTVVGCGNRRMNGFGGALE